MNCKSWARTGQYHTALKPPQLVRAETVYISMEHSGNQSLTVFLHPKRPWPYPTVLDTPHHLTLTLLM